MTLLLFALLLSDPRPSELMHTYSIVAYDARTGEVGAAVQSHWFQVGPMCLWLEPGVGAVATQSFVRVDYGPLGLQAMASGESPDAALKRLLTADPGEAVRQVAMVDVQGRVAAHTGSRAIEAVCDRQGVGYSVQANLMLKDGVCDAMAMAFEASADQPLADRLVAALAAAQAAGGDARGKQSAALKVVSAKKPDVAWGGVLVDLRVDDHARPVKELARLLTVDRAFEAMGRGDRAIAQGDFKAAEVIYRKAAEAVPGNPEPRFWQAVNLTTAGQLELALPIFAEVFRADANYRVLPKRLAKVGLLPDDAKIIQQIEAQ